MEIPQRPATVIIASLVIVAALASLWFRFHPSTPLVDHTAGDAIASRAGTVLAEETVKAIDDHGRLVLVIDRDDPSVVAFLDELKKHGSISLITTEIALPDPQERRHCSSATFKRLLDQYAQADAIVFGNGLPEWSTVAAALPEHSVKIIALDNDEAFHLRAHYSGYFAKGFLSALIAHRADAKPSDPHRAPLEWFDQHYQVYTPENYDSLQNVDAPQTGHRPH